MHLIASRHILIALIVVTFWTPLFTLHAHGKTKSRLATTPLNTLGLVFSERLTQDLKQKNAMLTVDLQFYNQKWVGEDYSPRREMGVLVRRISQLNAHFVQASQAASSMNMFNDQHPRLPALRETMRTTRAQIEELEAELTALQRSATLRHHWTLTYQDLQSGKAMADLSQTLALFKHDSLQDIHLRLLVQADPSIKGGNLEWNGSLMTLLQQMKPDGPNQAALTMAEDISLLAYRRDLNSRTPATQECEPCRYR
ncbi:MAG: hypothetical protein AB7N80_09110 [Bdellovibrionales bacterium]